MIKKQDLSVEKGKSINSKICLGTVQFGLDYGIANKSGKIPENEVFEILKYANKVGVEILDTSMAYGDSEKIIGEFIKEKKSFNVISKVLFNSEFNDLNGIRLKLIDSLHRLNLSELYGYLIHRFDDFLNHKQIWNALESVKVEGLASKIGFSLYRPEELELLLDREIKFDIVQIPFSILDRRFEKYFKILKDKNVEIHARSVFLQGLVFLKPEQLPNKLQGAIASLGLLGRIAKKNNLSISAICLNNVLSNTYIDKVVIGVDSLNQFKNNIVDVEQLNVVVDIVDDLRDCAILDEQILLPNKW